MPKAGALSLDSPKPPLAAETLAFGAAPVVRHGSTSNEAVSVSPRHEVGARLEPHPSRRWQPLALAPCANGANLTAST